MIVIRYWTLLNDAVTSKKTISELTETSSSNFSLIQYSRNLCLCFEAARRDNRRSFFYSTLDLIS